MVATSARGGSQLLFAVVAALLVLNAAGLIISVVAELPTEFDTTPDPDNVLEDSVSKGTLLAGPMTAMAALIVAAVFVRWGGRWLGALGFVIAIVIGVLFTIGSFGEPLQPEASDPPVAFLVAWKVVGVGLALALAGLSATGLYRRVRPQRQSSIGGG